MQGPYFGDGGVLQQGSQQTIPLTRPDAPIEYVTCHTCLSCSQDPVPRQRSRPTFDGYSFANVYSFGALGTSTH